MKIKNIHFWSGGIITIFVVFHLANHAFSLWGAEKHIELMNMLRVVYRHPVAETALLGAVLLQVVTGIRLFLNGRQQNLSPFARLQRWSGLYLALFFSIHISAVMVGRNGLHLDTNFYFGVAGLNSFPSCLFFIPYYSLAVLAFFAHLASIHYHKMTVRVLGLDSAFQAKIIIFIGFLFTDVLMYGLTNQFQGVVIPKEYHILIGK